ncbi:ribbon-helix-helix domain-containing protein [Candidatus Bathyarchaeota archaeon]|nr:ribbon-helix-helix domain-containing protein [Candidatus Bathyarchaeota archaeon]
MDEQKPICEVKEIKRKGISSEFRVRLRPDVYEALEKEAKRKGMTVAEFINYEVILKFVRKEP